MIWVIIFPIFFAQSTNTWAQSCEVFPIGNDQIIAHQKSVYSVQFSPDGKKVVTASNDGTAIIRDLSENEKDQAIAHQKSVYSVQFSPDGKKVVTASKDGTAIIRDLSGQEKDQVITHSEEVNSAQFSPDGKKVVTASRDGTAIIRDLSGQEKDQVITHSGYVNSAVFSPDGNKVVFASNDTKAINGKVIIRDLSGQEKDQVITHSSYVNSAVFSPDGKKVVTASSDGEVIIRDLSGKEKDQVITHSDWVFSAQFSPDGKKIVTASRDGTAIIRDLSGQEKDQVITHSDWVFSAQFSPDGKKVVTASRDGTAIIHDLSSICFDLLCSVNDSSLACNGTNQNNRTAISIHDDVKKLHLQQLCAQNFEKTAWDQETPAPEKSLDLSPLDAYQFLLRFQKPDGFDPQIHLPILVAILKSDLITSQSALVAGALQSVLYQSNQLYQDLLAKFPALINLRAKENSPCRSTEELKKLQNAAWNYCQYLMSKYPLKSTFSNYASLGLLASILSAEQKAEAIAQITEKLANSAADTPELHGVFLSKIYYFAKNGVKKLFGENPPPMSDLTLVREAQVVRPIILGPLDSMPAANLSQNFGFSVQLLDKIPLSPKGNNIEKNFNWVVDGKKYQSAVKIQDAPLATTGFIAEDKAPRYDQLWANGNLHGIVITGSNLRNFADSTMGEYLAYFQSQGFAFNSTKEKIANLEEFLKNRIRSGEADYFIKEAHSDGDEKNLFRIDTSAEKLVGRKKYPDGKEEIVELIFPTAGAEKTKLISNGEFGEWMQAREKSGQGQFVYFNTSCWSKTKAINEIETAQSKVLVNIPTLTSAYTFQNYPENAEYQLLTAFREKKDYAEIRTALKNNEGYKARKSDVFIFPDEEDYQKNITDVLKTPLEITVEVRDESGRVINIDEQH